MQASPTYAITQYAYPPLPVPYRSSSTGGCAGSSPSSLGDEAKNDDMQVKASMAFNVRVGR